MIHAARDYLWTCLVTDEADSQAGGDVGNPGYGSVAMDMLAPSHWSPVDTVRAQSWHDVHLGEEPADPPGAARGR